MENRNSSTFPLLGLSGLFDYQGEINDHGDLVRHRKLLNFSPWPFRSHPAKLKVTIKSWCQHIIPCPGDPMTVQMTHHETQAQKLQKPQKFPTSKKIVSKCPGIPWENERFHRPRKGRQHRQRIWDLRLCFGTWQFWATQCWQPKFIPKIENVNPGTPSPSKARSTKNINSSQCDIHVRLVSWIQSPGSTRETTLGDFFLIQCLHPSTLPLNLPDLRNIELSWIILDYW